jgi:signal transduction histidine kinase
MSLGDDPPPDGSPDPLDLLQHDLKTPLVTIHARAQLLARSIQRSPSLANEERVRMLDGVAAIEEAVRAMVITIDGMKGKDSS